MPTLLKDLISIPEHVHKSDFVLRLTSGVDNPASTLKTYVVTPQLVDAFGRALALIRSAIDDGASKAAYLHGSFGSGKSHFMAVLHLLLQKLPAVREVEALRPLIATHAPWLDSRKFLVVPYHMIGAKSMEEAILGHYVHHVRTLHPGCPLPAVYLADKIFENAVQLRANMGDEAFFRVLNGRPVEDKWKGMETRWHPTSFEEALLAPVGDERRDQLVSDIVSFHLPVYRDVTSSFVPLDQGLEVLTRHAKDLGYDALILFLDELILWLVGQIADVAFVTREGQKLAKLVESQHSRRPIPLVSFVARQRDLRDLIGSNVPGAEQLGAIESLRHMEGRFSKITLEDRNLAAVAEKRILAPVSAAAKAEIDESFQQTKKFREEIMRVLLTENADPEIFRRLYPFSPALVQTLVAVSGALQRERTALRAMVQLLSNRRRDLALGDIVPVGDLYDVMAEGDEPFTEGLRVHFDNAKRLWTQKLLPMLEQEARLSQEQIRELPPDDPRARRFAANGRFLKTLLLAALVPDVEALRNLTVRRLCALNHGSIRSPIPGQEVPDLLERCRQWAARVGELKLADDSTGNALVQIQLVGVDLSGVIERGLSQDNAGNRKNRLREILFESMGIQTADQLSIQHRFLWRGTHREVEVQFRNIREMPLSELKARPNGWKFVIDFPFDVENHVPRDDVHRAEEFLRKEGRTSTFCWIPFFFTREVQADLGRLVAIEHVLKPSVFDDAAAYLAPADRATAKSLLENQRDQLRAQIRLALQAAYGAAEADPRYLDLTNFDPGEGLKSLEPTFRPKAPIGSSLREAFHHLLGQVFEFCFPAHPDFGGELRPAATKRILDTLRPVAATEDNRVVIEKEHRPLFSRVAAALRLGQMGEDAFALNDPYWVSHFNRLASGAGAVLPVTELRAAIDTPRAYGLPRDLQDLILLLFAERTKRAVFRYGAPYEAAIGDLPDDCELREAVLPTEAEWKLAQDRASRLFGLALPKLRAPSTVAAAASELKRRAELLRGDAHTLRQRLTEVLARYDVPKATSLRYAAAESSLTLLERLATGEDKDRIPKLAQFELTSDLLAMGASLASAATLGAALSDEPMRMINTLANWKDERAPEAAAALARLREALTKDELVIPLQPVITAVREEAYRLITPPAPKGDKVASTRGVVEQSSAQGLDAAALEATLARLRAKLLEDPTRRLDLTWVLTGPKKDRA